MSQQTSSTPFKVLQLQSIYVYMYTRTQSVYIHGIIYYSPTALCISQPGLGLCLGSLLQQTGPLPDQRRDCNSTNTAEHIHSDTGRSGPAHSTQGVGRANFYHDNGLLDI